MTSYSTINYEISLNGSFHQTICHSLFLSTVTIDGENNHSKKKLNTEASPWLFTPSTATESTGQRLKELRHMKYTLEGTIVLKAYS